MAVSKVIYGNNTLIDLTADTVEASKLAQGITAHGADGEPITGTNTYDADTSDADAVAAEILVTKTAYVNGNKITGSMANNGAVSGSIATKEGVYNVPIGFHDGSGTVGIDETEQSKIIAQNIREGITILGVEGSMTGTEDVTAESPTVTPYTTAQTITPSEGYNYISQVTVQAIAYTEVDNTAGGKTVTIGTVAPTT